MNKTQKTIIFINYFGTGIFVPVLSLFFLEHGCTLSTLALVMGIYATVVIVAEFPSGLYADIRGRKSSIYLSSALTFCGFLIMYTSFNIFFLVLGVVLFGLGKAFISGSFDSLMIENCIKTQGKENMSKYISTFLIFQSAGIAFGALFGGLIPNVSGYFIHFILRELILLIMCSLCITFLKESLNSQTTTIKELILSAKQVTRKNYELYTLMFCMLGSMFIVYSVEIYWQPEIKTLLLDKQNYLLGIISALGYTATIIGSILGGCFNMKSKKSKWLSYLLFSPLPVGILFLMSMQYRITGFVICYILFLLSLGLISVPEQTLLNSMISNETRASILSVSSVFSQLGGVFISFINATLVDKIGVREVWVIGGTLTCVVILISSISVLILRKKVKCF